MNFEQLLAFKLPRGKVNQDLNKWLDKVFELNKARIRESYERAGLEVRPRSQFKRSVKEYMQEGRTLKGALKYMANTETYTPEELKFRVRASQALQESHLINEVRKRAKSRGRFDVSELKYVGDNTYVYEDNVGIYFGNSPEVISVYNISKNKPKDIQSNLNYDTKMYEYGATDFVLKSK